MKENIFLTGFSGTGKSSTGPELAKQLGYEYIDSDLQIEADTGRSVSAIFAEDGEASFRELERATLEKICEYDNQVVSTGGGAVLLPANLMAMTANGYIVCLEARPETILVRLMLDSVTRQGAADRPLLRGDEPFERIKSLKATRQPLYAEADWTIHTDFLGPEEVAGEIIRALDLIRRRSEKTRGGPGSPASPGSPHTASRSKPFHRGGIIGRVTGQTQSVPETGPLTVRTSSGTYPVVFGEGLLERLGEWLAEYGPDSAGRAVFVISDESVGPHYLPVVEAALQKSGYRVQSRLVPAGEESKSLAQVAALYDWLASQRAERKDIVLALGGGVVGDLAGFVASSWLRGLPFIQVPTTLLAMVDSSVGGKTGVNHATGKNLIGAFYPPRAVLADVLTLDSLPERARRSGWAEVVKHGVIPGAGSEQEAQARFERLEKNVKALMAGERGLTAAILRESVAVKAGVVEEDERETGLRMTLNYGHTIAHGLENAGHYNQLLHGEAVAIGMHGVALLAHALGLCNMAFVERQRALLEAFGLPVSASQFKLDRAAVLNSMKLDKKADSGAIRWILPRSIGRVEISNKVPPETVAQVVDSLLGQPE